MQLEKHVSENISKPFIGKWSNRIQYSEGILEVCNFRIVSYQIWKNWLKVRHGLPLNTEDIQRYKHIVMILKEIVKLTEDIRTTIQHTYLKKLEIFEKVRDIVAEELEIETYKVTIITDFNKNLGANSLETVQLMMAFENAFNIEIPDQISKSLLTVQKTVDYISQKIETTI